MKSFRMNADYELELFLGKRGSPIINESLEFLLFFLESDPVYSSKKYEKEYFDYVEQMTTRRPQLTTSGDFENYWGTLKNIERERWWNSKITSTKLIIDRGWCSDTFIINNKNDLSLIDPNKTYLIKDPFGMSGQKFSVIGPQLSMSEKELIFNTFLNRGMFILEPFLKRVYDFSHYVYPNGKIIFYQNFIDQKFQYRGTYFHHLRKSEPESLIFYSGIENSEWSENKKKWDEIHTFLSQHENQSGYSVDSFVYLEDGKNKIRPMSEINYRRTMGRVAFEIAEKFSMTHHWSANLIVRNLNPKIPIWKKINDSSLSKRSDLKVIGLSPGDTRFDMVFISGDASLELRKIILELKKLLPECEFAVDV
jgi:hypothetical protein